MAFPWEEHGCASSSRGGDTTHEVMGKRDHDSSQAPGPGAGTAFPFPEGALGWRGGGIAFLGCKMSSYTCREEIPAAASSPPAAPKAQSLLQVLGLLLLSLVPEVLWEEMKRFGKPLWQLCVCPWGSSQPSRKAPCSSVRWEHPQGCE